VVYGPGDTDVGPETGLPSTESLPAGPVVGVFAVVVAELASDALPSVTPELPPNRRTSTKASTAATATPDGTRTFGSSQEEFEVIGSLSVDPGRDWRLPAPTLDRRGD